MYLSGSQTHLELPPYEVGPLLRLVRDQGADRAQPEERPGRQPTRSATDETRQHARSRRHHGRRLGLELR